jgi:hypothetical protein
MLGLAASEITTSPDPVVVTGEPEGEVVAGWLLRDVAKSRGALRSAPENSQMTTVPAVTVALGVIVRVVAPAVELRANHISAMDPVVESFERAPPASE